MVQGPSYCGFPIENQQALGCLRCVPTRGAAAKDALGGAGRVGSWQARGMREGRGRATNFGTGFWKGNPERKPLATQFFGGLHGKAHVAGSNAALAGVVLVCGGPRLGQTPVIPKSRLTLFLSLFLFGQLPGQADTKQKC